MLFLKIANVEIDDEGKTNSKLAQVRSPPARFFAPGTFCRNNNKSNLKNGPGKNYAGIAERTKNNLAKFSLSLQTYLNGQFGFLGQ